MESFASIFNEERIKEPKRKTIDIIEYSIKSIEWIGFNILLIMMPIIIFYIEGLKPEFTNIENSVSWEPVIISLIVLASV